MKTILALTLTSAGTILAACEAKVTPLAPQEKVVEKNTTIVNPPGEKKVENNTTIVNPPPAPATTTEEKKTTTTTTETK